MKICKAVLTLVLTIANLAFASAASADTVEARCQTGLSPVGAWQQGANLQTGQAVSLHILGRLLTTR